MLQRGKALQGPVHASRSHEEAYRREAAPLHGKERIRIFVRGRFDVFGQDKCGGEISFRERKNEKIEFLRASSLTFSETERVNWRFHINAIRELRAKSPSH